MNTPLRSVAAIGLYAVEPVKQDQAVNLSSVGLAKGEANLRGLGYGG